MTGLVLIWRRFADGLAAVAFAVMFFGFVTGIISRYVFNSPLSWPNELCVIAYVWIVFWTSDILLRERQHIIFDVLYGLMPPRVQRAAAVVVTLSLALLFLAVLPGTLDYTWFQRTRHTTMLRLPMMAVYGCFAIFVVAVVVNALVRLRHLASRDWQRYL
jgi:TRAP-type C4-dicarboxylate transport system permease small subunit